MVDREERFDKRTRVITNTNTKECKATNPIYSSNGSTRQAQATKSPTSVQLLEKKCLSPGAYRTMAEFLPLCDVLFNVISLAGYFCDIVFDMVFCYALLERGRTVYVGVVLLLVSTSLVISQIVSLRWYLHKSRTRNAAAIGSPIGSLDKKKVNTSASIVSAVDAAGVAAGPTDSSDDRSTLPGVSVPATRRQRIGQYCVIGLHCSQLGVLWRYAKLFVPVDLRHVKHEVRDLCLLRLVHAFCEAAPMLLLQLHVLVTMQPEDYLIPLPEIRLKTLGGSGGSIAASAASVAGLPNSLLVSTLSSGGQHQHHLQHLHQLQPTLTAMQERQLSTFRDLNVVSAMLSLFSVCWALASFSKNVRLQNVHRLVLTWLGVIFQFLWRLGTVVSRVTALTVYASLYGYWIFLVLVLHWFSMFLWLISPKNVFHGERITRVRKASLAALIAGVYVFAYVNLQQVKHRQKMVTFYVVMFLENWLLVCLWLVGVWPQRPENWWAVPALVLGSFMFGMAFLVLYYRYFHVRRLGYEAGGRFPGDPSSKYSGDPETGRVIIAGDLVQVDGTKNPAHAIPGVFNCRFSNPVGSGATKRKKKKPTTFIPPPTLSAIPSSNASQNSRVDHCAGGSHSGSLADSCSQQGGAIGGGLMSIPFWRRPLPRSNAGGSSENEGSAGSRVNIQQKLQEKKQKQLAELKIIEEEIKQGKLGGPLAGVSSHIMMDGSVIGMTSPHGLSNGGLSADEAVRCGSLMRQPIPRAKKHINVEPIEWRSVSPGDTDDTCCGRPDIGSGPNGSNGIAVSAAATKAYNDLNGVLLSSSNLDEVNNLNKYTSNYDPLYNSFGLNSINIPALGTSNNALQMSDGPPLSASQTTVAARNMSPISSQISATESNSLTRVVAAPRTKMLPARNPFAESYHRGGGASAYADGATAAGGNGGAGGAAPSISPRNTTDSPNRLLVGNHPRQISGTYSSSIENSGVECLPFPYSVVPPPRSKLDSSGSPAGTMTAHAAPPPGGGVSLPSTGCGGGGGGAINKSFNIQQQQQQQQRMMALRQMQRAKTPEILLAPHYLDNSRIYYDWVSREQQQSPSVNAASGMQQMMQMMRPLPSYGAEELHHHQSAYQQQQHMHHHHHIQLHHRLSSGDENLDDMDESVLSGEGAHRNGGGGHSDIDSQVSLPRSYTLPREFKYYRRNKTRKLIKNEHFITSTNSSDGDVDSGDDNESDATPTPLPIAVTGNGHAAAPAAPMIHQPSAAAAAVHHLNISHHHRALVNQSQRRLRPPTAAVRTHFHQHQPPQSGINVGGHHSPVGAGNAAAVSTLHSSATSSPLSHQAAAYAASGRLMPPGVAAVAVAMPSYMQHQLQHQQHTGVDDGAVCAAALKPINHLDVIDIGSGPQLEYTSAGAPAVHQHGNANGSGGAANVMNRQMRLRLYGNSKGMGGGGIPRHETKL